MKAFQLTLDEKLVLRVDRVAKKLGTTRSALTRMALVRELDRVRTGELEEKHRKGFTKKPLTKNEWDGWENEQTGPAF